MFEPDGRNRRPTLGLQLLSNVQLLARPHGSHPLPRLLRSRSETTVKKKPKKNLHLTRQVELVVIKSSIFPPSG